MSQSGTLLQRWDVNGLFFTREPLPEADSDLAMRFFSCYKNTQTDRMIGDRRSRNYVEGKLAKSFYQNSSFQFVLQTERTPTTRSESLAPEPRPMPSGLC